MGIVKYLLASAAAICLSGASALHANNHESLIQAAKREGKLVVYTSMTVDQAQKLNDAFKVKYPFIQPSMFRAVGERLLTKIMAEAQRANMTSTWCSQQKLKLTSSKRKVCSPSMFHPKRKTFTSLSSIRMVIGPPFT